MSEFFDDDDSGRPDPYAEESADDGVALAAPRTNQLVRKSMLDGVSAMAHNAATQALTAKATADINARWMIAMHRPRDIQDVRVRLLHECKRPGFAAAAIYAVPRGKGTVKGLSIRFAEAAMGAMGNMGAEAQTLYDSDEQRVVRVSVTDYEANTAWSRDLTVSKTKEQKQLRNGQRAIRERTNSYGDVVYIVEATDDDVTTKESSAISKASRTGVLRQVPAWLLAECRLACEQTANNKAAEDPDTARRKIFDAFAQMSAPPSWLAEWLGHPVEQATPAEIVDLQQLYRAIRDGQTTLSDAMRARKGEKTSGAAAAVSRGDRKSRSAPPKQSDPATVSPDEAAEIAVLEAKRQ